MTQFIEQLFHNLFGGNVWLATILIAMVPVIELKGAIPFSMSAQIWGGEALGLFHAFLAGLVGSSLVVPVLVLLYKPIINLLKKTKLFRNLAQKIEERVNSKKRKVEQDISGENDVKMSQNVNSNGVKVPQNVNSNDVKMSQNVNSLKKRIAAVFVFVALPFPFTGVWTGACLAVALGLNFWQATTTVVLGNVVAGAIIAFVSWLFGDATLIFFYAFLAFILAGILFFAIRAIVRKHKAKRANVQRQ